MFKYVNTILYDKILTSTFVESASLELSKVMDYLMDQGVAYEVIRKRETELKEKLPSVRITEESVMDEAYILHFKSLVG